MSEKIAEQVHTPGDYSSFAATELRVTDTAAVSSPTDEANLIVTVYDKLGLLGGDAKEQLTEFLPVDIATLRGQHDGLEPFLALNLTDRFGLRALVSKFDTAYRGKFTETFYWEPYWDKVKLDDLNKRTAHDTFRPVGQLSLRGAVLTAENEYDEAGLILTNRTTEEQNAAAAGMDLFNQTDWLLNEALHREAGLPSLDKQTFTRFPQQPEIMVGGVSVVGRAYSLDSQAKLLRSDGKRHPFGGVRRSVGLTL